MTSFCAPTIVPFLQPSALLHLQGLGFLSLQRYLVWFTLTFRWIVFWVIFLLDKQTIQKIVGYIAKSSSEISSVSQATTAPVISLDHGFIKNTECQATLLPARPIGHLPDYEKYTYFCQTLQLYCIKYNVFGVKAST